ncbi:MAG: hypothetical protein IJK89_11730 [Clostridia bacterium]|nr:hypothetical protein [Clostridia bacterium]
MKKVKIIAVITAALVLFGVYFSSAYALGDGLGALGEYFGLSGNNGGNSNSDDPDANDEIQTQGNAQANLDSGLSDILQGLLGNAADAFSSSQLTDILNNFDINAILGGDSDMLNELMDLLGANQPTTSKNNNDSDSRSQTPSQQYTVPQYTNVYVTDAPAVTYNYSGSAATTLPGETTTGTGETTTLYYLTPSTVYAEQITTLPYDYPVGTTEVSEKDGFTLKTIIGIAILLISGVAVVGVALSLKKSRV